MENSVAIAKAATESLLEVVHAHMDDTLCHTSLGDFLPIASKALDIMSELDTEELAILQQYRAACERLTKAIRTEDSSNQSAWKDTTFDGKSWSVDAAEIQSCINDLLTKTCKKLEKKLEKSLKTLLLDDDKPPPYKE